MRRVLKAVLVGAARRWRPANPSARVVVLCYHSVDPAKAFASATPEVFDIHLQWLTQHCEIVRFSTIAEAWITKANHPRVVLTFDDGYADNYEYAFPLLQKRAITATFFTTVGLIENDSAVLDRFQLLRHSSYSDIRPLTWPHIREMARAGMDFGAHTYSHSNLAVLPRPAALLELQRSKEIMEERLGQPVSLLAYPFGKPRRHFTSETVCLTAEAGYESAATVLYRAVRPGDSQLQIPRFYVTRDDIPTLRDKILGAWDLMGVWQERAPLWAARALSPSDFLRLPGITPPITS